METARKKAPDVTQVTKVSSHLSAWAVAFGMVAGLVAGLVMAGIGYALPVPMMHNEPFFISAVDMMKMSSMVLTGWILHIFTSIVIGALFGLTTAKVVSLRVSGYERGLLWGGITGVIAYCLLFLPTILSPMPGLFSNSTFMLESVGYNIVYGLILGLLVVVITNAKFGQRTRISK